MTLEGHVRKGSVYLPKFLTGDTPFFSSSWEWDRFPHYSFLAKCIDDCGENKCIEAINDMTMHYKRCKMSGGIKPQFVHSHYLIDDDNRRQIDGDSKGSDWREVLQDSIDYFASMFPESPISYLKTAGNVRVITDSDIGYMGELIAQTRDRHSRRSLRIQAVSVMIEIQSGFLKIPSGMQVPDLSLAVEYPNGDAACSAAGFAVTNCQIICAVPVHADERMRWRNYFWDTCLKFGKCEAYHGQ